MERIITFYTPRAFVVVKTKAETANYITLESIFPIEGIKADYFDEEENFLLDASLPTIKKFAYTIMHPFQRLIEPAKCLYGLILSDMNMDVNNKELLLTETKEFLEGAYQELDFRYISSRVYKDLIKQHLSYAKTKKTSYKCVVYQNSVTPMEKTIEILQGKILQTGINHTYFFHHNLMDDYRGLQYKWVPLATSDFPEEKLLQELFLCLYSKDKKENLFEEFYFENRFNSFHEQKKLSLFLVSSASKELFMYNKFITKFMMNRY